MVVDNGRQFRSRQFLASAEGTLAAQVCFLGTYAHWAAGEIERFHRVINERVRCHIYDFVSLKQAELGSKFGKITIPVSAEWVKTIVNKILLRYNANPRHHGKSPHNQVSSFVPWIYPELRKYRPRSPDELEPLKNQVASTQQPQVGDKWIMRVKSNEGTIWKNVPVSPKLKPQYDVVTIVNEERPGVFNVKRGNSFFLKERAQRFKLLPSDFDTPQDVLMDSSGSEEDEANQGQRKSSRRKTPKQQFEDFELGRVVSRPRKGDFDELNQGSM